MKITLPGAVFLVFLIMKLTNYIAWSWWWVTAPLWGAAAVSLAAVLVVLLVGGLMWTIGSIGEAITKRRRRQFRG